MKEFILDLAKHYQEFTHGDLQAVIEAKVKTEYPKMDLMEQFLKSDSILQEVEKLVYDENGNFKEVI